MLRVWRLISLAGYSSGFIARCAATSSFKLAESELIKVSRTTGMVVSASNRQLRQELNESTDTCARCLCASRGHPPCFQQHISDWEVV